MSGFLLYKMQAPCMGAGACEKVQEEGGDVN